MRQCQPLNLQTCRHKLIITSQSIAPTIANGIEPTLILLVPRLCGLRCMVQQLCCVLVRACKGSLPHRGDELAQPILAAYYVLHWLTIDICCDICVCQIFEINSTIIIKYTKYTCESRLYVLGHKDQTMCNYTKWCVFIPIRLNVYRARGGRSWYMKHSYIGTYHSFVIISFLYREIFGWK